MVPSPTAAARCRAGQVSLVLALVCAGCGANAEGRKPVHPVRGTVLFQEKPAAGAFVLFVPVNEPAEAKDPRPRATAEADGSFSLSTYGGGDGAPAGEYVVTLTWPGGVLPDGREEPEDKFHGRFSDPKTSRIRITVKEGPNELPPFRLK